MFDGTALTNDRIIQLTLRLGLPFPYCTFFCFHDATPTLLFLYSGVKQPERFQVEKLCQDHCIDAIFPAGDAVWIGCKLGLIKFAGNRVEKTQPEAEECDHHEKQCNRYVLA